MIYLVLLLALILRLINLNQSLWWDEAINILAVKNLSLWQMLTSYPLTDFHPPLYFGILWVWSYFFGITEIVARIPSVIFGLLTIFLVYLIGKELFSKRVGLLAALFLSLNPLHIFYSQEARMYSLAAFSVSFYFWSLIGVVKQKRWSSLFLILSTTLVVYSDYVSYLSLIVGMIWISVYYPKFIKKILSLSLVSFLFYLPWLTIFPKQLENGRLASVIIPGWGKVVGGAGFKDLILVFVKSMVGKFSLNNKLLYGLLLIPGGVLYFVSIVQTLRSKDKFAHLILLWSFLPIILAYLISFYIPVLSYFRLIFILPALALSLSIGISHFKNTLLQKSIIIGIILVNLFFSTCYFLNPDFQRENWKGMVNDLKSLPGDFVVLFEDVNLPAPFIYYDNHDFPSMAALTKFPAGTEADLIDLSKINSNKIYLVEYLVDISDPNRLVQAKLDTLGFKRIDVKNFSGVGLIYEYSKSN